MMTKQVSHFVKFIFHTTNQQSPNCFATSDIDELLKFKHKPSNNKLSSLEVGDELIYNGATYKVDSIKIYELTDDLTDHDYGIDSNDCTGIFGRATPYLFKISVNVRIMS